MEKVNVEQPQRKLIHGGTCADPTPSVSGISYFRRILKTHWGLYDKTIFQHLANQLIGIEYEEFIWCKEVN